MMKCTVSAFSMDLKRDIIESINSVQQQNENLELEIASVSSKVCYYDLVIIIF